MDNFSKDDSSDEEDSIVDSNTCTDRELNEFFKCKYFPTEETAVSLKRSYVLYLTATSDFNKIACGTSDKLIQVFDITSASKLSKLSLNHDAELYKDTVCGVKFSTLDNKNLFVGLTNGTILMYDLRTNKVENTFKDEDNRPLTCLDINQNNRTIVAGTELVNNESFILFFDIRTSGLMGGYWESHTDDITQVLFHSENPDYLTTGSVDGLINVFNIVESSEDDALQYSLNTESSVQYLNWHKNVYGKDLISCITHTNDFHMYDVDESELLFKAFRSEITEQIKRKSVIDCNLIGCHNMNNDDIFILAGSNYNRGECLRSLQIQNKKCIPHGTFMGNKQIIRCSLYDRNNNILITGGENGLLSIWSSNKVDEVIIDKKFKEKLHFKDKRKNKPYK